MGCGGGGENGEEGAAERVTKERANLKSYATYVSEALIFVLAVKHMEG